MKYEYECRECGRFEYSQSMKDEPIKVCPVCGAPVERIVSATTVIFKGEGWPGKEIKSPRSSRRG